MPSVAPSGRGKRGSNEASLDNDGDDGGRSSARESSEDSGSDRSKRIRLHGASRSASRPNGNAPGDPMPQPTNGAGSGNREAPMQHQPGSIVRMKLANFVTYTAVEILPGPSLNMVIGPNGTGKSTIVCAVCLGLGWGSQHLGRAKDVGDFVRNGAHEALIEIELCADGKKFKRNPIIRCLIKRESNKCTYSVNDKPASKKTVNTLARSFSIQVDNLCQFLPQDKVVEFAAMTPVELLQSTQRAIASPEMIGWHESLKKYRVSQRQIEDDEKANREELGNLESRQRMQEADVERLRERENVKQTITYLEAARPIAAYRDAQKKFREAKSQRQEAMKELKELEAEVEPVLKAVNAKQRYADVVKRVLDARIARRKRSEQNTEEAAANIQDLGKEIERKVKAIEKEVTKANDARQDEIRFAGIIKGLRKRLEEPAPEFYVAAFNLKIRDRDRELVDVQTKGSDIRENLASLKTKGDETLARLKNAHDEIESLNSQAGQQMAKLSRTAPDTYRAWKWIQQNQERFEKQVFGPPIVECTVKDPKVIDMLETVIQPGDLIALTAQTQNDFAELHRALHEELRLKSLTIKKVLEGLNRFPTPNLDNRTKQQYGLDGWVLDYLDGPEPVLAMLCDGSRINQTAIAWMDSTQAQYELIAQSRITSWVTPQHLYQIRRRAEYGPSAVSTSVRGIKKAQIWTDRPVDAGDKEELQRNIRQWESDVNDIKQQIEAQRDKFKEQGKRRDDIENEKRTFEKEKAEKQKELSNYNGLPTRIEQQEAKLAAAQREAGNVRNRIRNVEKQHDSLLLDKGQATLDFAKCVENLRTIHSEVIEAEIVLLEARSDYEILTERNKYVKQRLDAMQTEITRLNKIVSDSGDIARKARDVVAGPLKQAIMDDDGLGHFITKYSAEHTELSMESLDGDIDAEKAKLELMHEGGDGSILVRYEERALKIERIRKRLAATEASLAEITGRIDEVRAHWEPELDRMVALISDSFAHNMGKIDCAGEVSVDKPGTDFDSWAICIQVKFRESEPLSQLDAHRQSGGERAVSTIFYLMSLQSLTRSPFRVVDEINQGMDPRNERLVHARMVAIATGRDDWTPPDHLLRPTVGATNGARSRPSRGTADSDAGEGVEEIGDDDDGVTIHEDEDVDDGDEGEGHVPGRVQMRTSGRNGMGMDGASGSQYFLITPKLLHELKYEHGMRVLCIASGEHINEYAKGDPKTQGISFKRSLEIRKALNAKARAATAMAR